MSIDISDRVVVITGASSGFGEAIARRCAATGARLVLAARSAAPLERLVAELGPDRVLAVPTDVTDDNDVTRLAQRALERFGRVDVLVNNAGYGIIEPFDEASLGDLQGMMDVNVYGAVRCTKAFLPHMRARRSGQIIMVASLAGVTAPGSFAFYGATKFALVGLTRNLQLDLAGSGVRCALLCPGVAMTQFMQRADLSKFPRITRLATCTAEQVGAATLRAIARSTNGEIMLPRRGRLVAAIAAAFPGASRTVTRLINRGNRS